MNQIVLIDSILFLLLLNCIDLTKVKCFHSADPNKILESQEVNFTSLNDDGKTQNQAFKSEAIESIERMSQPSMTLDHGYSAKKEDQRRNMKQCSLPNKLINEIGSYQGVVNSIIEKTLVGSYRNRSYNTLSIFVDKFGSRLAGTKNLERSIKFLMKKMRKYGLENVHGEKVSVPHWIRGRECAVMISPRIKKLEILGLGYSVGTPPLGITADVLVVESFNDLKENAAKALGKIVVFNQAYESYDFSVKYRDSGAVEAAKVGAVAVLIRSITPFSQYSPHTGALTYGPLIRKIPAACITVEDAELMHRMQQRGWKITVKLKMEDFTLPNVISRNAVGEIVGRESPDEVVIISGHIDSWDVGQGAMDDGGGSIISIEALALLKSMDLKPRRTLRSVLWTAEEFGLIGAQQYARRHKRKLDKFNVLFESDLGTNNPVGLGFAGTHEASCIMQEVLKLFRSINMTTFTNMIDGSDIDVFSKLNIPSASLSVDNKQYFYYHHSRGDTLSIVNSRDLDICTAFWAAASYVVADLSISLPRK